MYIDLHIFLWKSAIYYSINLPFDAEVAEKFLNDIWYLYLLYSFKPLNCTFTWFMDHNIWQVQYKKNIFNLLLKPESLCLVFKQSCQIKNYAKDKKICLFKNLFPVYKILDLVKLFEK